MSTALAVIKDLLEAGAHFGHQSHKWNPKMSRYIFDRRNGIHIIDLQKTVELLNEACAFLCDITAKGDKVLFVGTKIQAKDAIKEIAGELDMPYVAERWLGGMLTNLKTIRQSIAKLDRFEKMEADGTMQELSKKEQSMLNKEKFKLEKNLSGVRKMTSNPGAFFVIDAKKETIAIKEAKKLGIPVISVLDTNCDPDLVDYPIPANDDSIRTIRYILERVKDSISKGSQIWKKNEEMRKAKEAEEKAKEEAKKAEQRKKAEEAKKEKAKAEAEQKAQADAIIADLEKSSETPSN